MCAARLPCSSAMGGLLSVVDAEEEGDDDDGRIAGASRPAVAKLEAQRGDKGSAASSRGAVGAVRFVREIDKRYDERTGAKHLNQYRRVRKLGTGSYGSVWTRPA